MSPRVLLVAGVASLVLLACSAEPGVITGEARRSPTGAVTPSPPSTTATTTTGDTTPPTDPPETSVPETSVPKTSVPKTSVPESSVPDSTTVPVEELIDEGDAKSAREYDDFLLLALDDIQRWWSEHYPALYGDPFVPLRGGVYAAYPERTAPIPGCGRARETTYEQIIEFAAFYCPDGDFLVYDDGEDGVLYSLTEEFGPTILGVVMAHEFGHAIQSRSGVLRRDLATIVTEQQADCFAGAWVAHAASGESETLALTDDDVRVGLVAMITVRDPIGVDQFSEGGHGSAFDRVGAFQVGFTEGVERCARLVDEPLPLVPNVLQPDGNPQGNSAFGYGENQIVGLITNDLNDFWPQAVATAGGELPRLTVVPIESTNEIECEDPAGDISTGAVYCAASRQVYFDEPFAVQLYERFGDFVVGYVLGGAWSEAVQQALASPLTGEDRALLSDCLTGAWASDLIPDRQGNTSRNNAEIEAGDLDEAIQTALVVGDDSSTADVVGSGFEKIASFREGVLGGIDACTEQLPD